MFSSVTEAANESLENETWTDDGEEVVLILGADEYGSDSDEKDSRLPASPQPDTTPPVVSDPPSSEITASWAEETPIRSPTSSPQPTSSPTAAESFWNVYIKQAPSEKKGGVTK